VSITEATDKGRVCYHCGLPLPPRADWSVVIGEIARPMCCAGCKSVAQAIVDNGLVEYYRHRDALPESPREALPAALADLGLFDHPDFQKSFVRPIGEHEREAALILEGITCAACVWLNERHIAQQDGVTVVDINYATRRARVRWDDRRIRLSEILAAIAAIGYHAHPYDPGRSEQLAQKERRAALWRLFVAGFGMMQVMMYAVPAYIADVGTITGDIESLLRWASLLLTLPVVLYSAAPFFRSAWRDVRLRRLGMDVPVALGVGSAFAASVWATVSASGEVYFDSVTMFVFFLLGGRFLEMAARQKAVRGVEQLAKLLPAFTERAAAHVEGGFERIPVASLAVGDQVLVKAGDAFPADGVVCEGTTSVDEALLTGESRPLAKVTGDAVIGGSVNRVSPVLVRVTSVGEGTRLAAIRQLMDRAQAEKPRIVMQADRVAGYFVGVLLVLAAATAGAWYVLDPDRALWVFVSVLVVSCPCALSLATPVALTVARGTLSRNGLLVTRGQAIETLARATHFVFDKTGTLTHGNLRLVATQTFGAANAADALALAAVIEYSSEHAIGEALKRAAEAPGISIPAASSVRGIPGQGIEALVQGTRHRIGRIEFVAELAGDIPDAAVGHDGDGATLVGLGDERGWIAVFRFQDELRPGSRDLVDMLRQARHSVIILSGDSLGAVAAVAQVLGVSDARSGLTPQEKYEAIVALQRGGAVVAMVGDGVNDAPVLAKAQVSVAMGRGTELARTQADFVLLSDELGHLGQGIEISRRTLRVIYENLAWAFAYNVLAIPAAMIGWITPWMAGIGMSASSLLVVLNALRLQSSRRSRAWHGKTASAS
jgi:Cu2+-exporting ATPase